MFTPVKYESEDGHSHFYSKIYLDYEHKAYISPESGEIIFYDHDGNKKRYETHPGKKWFQMLSFLLENNGRMVSSEEIFNQIYGSEKVYGQNDFFEDDRIFELCKEIRKKDFYRCTKGNGFEIKKVSHSGSYLLSIPENQSDDGKNKSIDSNGNVSVFLSRAPKVDHYIYPEEWMDDLLTHAFHDGCRTHAITGERGIGKTELAKEFARCCVKKTNEREDLAFQNIFFATYMPQGLRDTITFMDCGSDYHKMMPEQETFESKISFLTSVKKPALLIIDNYDNELTFHEELSVASKTYKSLLSTNCFILFTSKVDLYSCSCIHQTKLTPLPGDSLYELFCSLYGEPVDEKMAVSINALINGYLCHNTYLTRLSAKLAQTCPIETIIEKFEALDVGGIDDPLDGRDIREAALIDHFKALFDLSKISADVSKVQLLYNTCLLPLAGIPYSAFFERAFNSESIPEMKRVFKVLKGSYWIQLSHTQISLHPMVREMLVQCPFEFQENYVARYIKHLYERLVSFKKYSDDLPYALREGVGACEVIIKMGIRTFDSTCLLAHIASGYDILEEKERVYPYGKLAIQWMNLIDADMINEYMTVNLARAYNVAGYAVLHAYHQPDSVEMAEMAFARCSGLLLRVEKNDETEKIYYANQGDIAALELVKKNYQKALSIHESNLKNRFKMFEKEASREIKQMIANSYKGIGTSHYYLAKEKDGKERIEELKLSFENNEQAVLWYRKAYEPEYHLDVSIAENRLAGTLQALSVYLKHGEKRKLCWEMLKRMQRSVCYLCAAEVSRELAIAVGNILSLSTILLDSDEPVNGVKEFLEETEALIDDRFSEEKKRLGDCIRDIETIYI